MFLEHVRYSDDWIASFYSPLAMACEPDFFGMFCRRVGALAAQWSANELGQSVDFTAPEFEQLALAPMRSHLEIDELFAAPSDDVRIDIISRQFRYWLKAKTGLFAVAKHPWDFISAFKKGECPWEALVSSSWSPVLKGQARQDENLKEFIANGLRTKQLDEWVLFMALQRQAVDEYYVPYGFLHDLTRTRYVLGRISLFLHAHT
jgi:hypothetical protein